MDRRTALKYTSLMTGVTISSAFATGFLSGCKPSKPDTGYQPQLLDAGSFAFLNSLSEVVIPETDTPGAIELGVAQQIDDLAYHCYSEEDKDKFISEVNALNASLSDGKAFEDLSKSKQVEEVKALEAGLDGEYASVAGAYRSLKGNIAAAYLATEYVGKNLLAYLPVPGEYQPCIPLSETSGKAWTYG